MAAAVAARSALRSATTSARSATAGLSANVHSRSASSPFRISSQKHLSTLIFRSPLEMDSVSRGPFAVNQGKVAYFSSDLKSSSNSKRFQRIQRKKIDMKRSNSSVGIVEGIEYDASRNSRIALVRWEGGASQRKPSTVEEFSLPERRLESSATTAIRGTFPFSSLPGTDYQIKKPSAKDIFTSAFSPRSKGETAYLPSSGFPRIVVAGAKPAFFAFVKKDKYPEGKHTFSLSEIEKWKQDSVLWEHRMKPKAAVSWHSFARQENLGNLRDSEHKNSKTKKDFARANRAPISYILASRQLRKGSMVMNFAKPPNSDLSRRNQKANAY
ncbi:hypothetical protein ACS0TY_015441 [Phlomoides rotata]